MNLLVGAAVSSVLVPQSLYSELDCEEIDLSR